MTKEGSNKIINFMTPRAGVLVLGCSHISHIVKVYYFFKNLLLYSHAYIRQTKYIVMMTKEGSTKTLCSPTALHAVRQLDSLTDSRLFDSLQLENPVDGFEKPAREVCSPVGVALACLLELKRCVMYICVSVELTMGKAV